MKFLSEEDARFASGQLVAGCDELERRLHDLLDSKGRVAEEVHAIRKLGKSLRGGFALFRLAKKSSREIQVIGRLLSEPRDAVSRLNTWQKLAWDGDSSTREAIFGLLEQQTHSAARRPPPATISWCVERVAAARKNLLELPPEACLARMNVGISKLGKHFIKRCRKLSKAGEENFHDARKALKAYLGAMAFLPQGSISHDPNMADLAEVLGDENDLATLSEWLVAHGFTVKFAPELWMKIEESRKLLQKQAMKDAALLVAANKP